MWPLEVIVVKNAESEDEKRIAVRTIEMKKEIPVVSVERTIAGPGE